MGNPTPHNVCETANVAITYAGTDEGEVAQLTVHNILIRIQMIVFLFLEYFQDSVHENYMIYFEQIQTGLEL